MLPEPSLAFVIRNTIIGGRSQGVLTGVGHAIGVGGAQVIDDAGNWVGTAPAVDFADLDNVPAGLDDGDDGTLAGLTIFL